MYFPNQRGTHLWVSLSKVPGGVSLKYAFKLMHDLIMHLHSARLLSQSCLPFLLHLLSHLIFFFLHCLPLPLSILFFHPHHPRPPPNLPFLSSSVVLCLIYSGCFKALIIYLKSWSALKGRNRRRARGGPGTPRPPPFSHPPSFVLPFTPIPASTVSVTPAAFWRCSCSLSLAHPSSAVAGGYDAVV